MCKWCGLSHWGQFNSLTFPTIFIGNHHVIEKLDMGTESQRIVTITSFSYIGFSHSSLMLIFFKCFSVANMLRNIGLLDNIKTENTKLPECELSSCANGMEWGKTNTDKNIRKKKVTEQPRMN